MKALGSLGRHTLVVAWWRALVCERGPETAGQGCPGLASAGFSLIT